MIGYIIAATLIGIGIIVGLMLGAFLDMNIRYRPEPDEHADLHTRDLF